MITRRRIAAVLALAAVFVGGTMAVVRADDLDIVPVPGYTYVYAGKFLCGEFDKFADANKPAFVEGPVKPGNYQTVFNVHNPHFSTVTIQKKAVLLFAGDRAIDQTEFEVPRPPGQLRIVTLKSDWGFYADCQDLRKVLLAGMAPPAPTFIEGWFVIYSPVLIDVETVVTSHGFQRNFQTGMIEREGFDTELERIQPTRVSQIATGLVQP